MQRRHTVLESPSVNLPQRDKDRLLVMSIGGSDVFGPNARNVQEWKKDTEEVRVKLISPSFRRTVEPRQGRQKEAFVVFNTSSSVSLAPVTSGCHHIPRSKDSYQKPPGQPFWRDSQKSSYKPKQSSSTKGQLSNNNKKPYSRSNFCPNPSTKKGGAEVEINVNRTDSLPVERKVALYQASWQEIFTAVSGDDTENLSRHSDSLQRRRSTILHCPLELHSNNKTSDLLQAMKKLLNSQAVEEVKDTLSLGYYSRLFLVTKPDGSFCPIIDLKKLNLFLDIPSLKMETLFSIIAALQPQEWITKIDLKDAYHHILVHLNIHKYFRFVIAGKTYQLHVLLFGLSMAPSEFTKALAPVVQLLST